MSRVVFLHPGQGSQHVGMGRSFHETSPVARALFARADALLEFDLSTLCFAGPETELRRTENAQPAMFVVSVVATALLRERGVEPDAAAGHSVGEYAALVTAGALSFEDGLRAVRRRGELMSRQSEREPGIMAAIVGLPLARIEALCDVARSQSRGPVEIANENGPDQTVVSGAPLAVEHVMDLVEDEGATALLLNVSGAFHSRLMEPVAPELSKVLDDIAIATPRIPVVANVTADYVMTPAEIRDALVRQIAGRVRWTAALLRLARDGADALIEVGPGRVLTRLARTVVPDMRAIAADDLLAAPLATTDA